MIAACERWFDYVGDEWGNSLVIGEGMSVAGGLYYLLVCWNS